MNVKGNLTTLSALSTTLTELNAESKIIKKKKNVVFERIEFRLSLSTFFTVRVF